MPFPSRTLSRVAVCSLLALAVLTGLGAKGGPIHRLKLDPDAERIDLFAGIADATLEVRVTPRDEFEANVFITNLSDKPVTVVAPKSIAAVPVLKQFAAGNGKKSPLGASGPFGQGALGQNDPNG